MNLQRAKRTVKNLLKTAGFELRRYGNAPSWEACLGNLKALGFQPRTVLDIGVASGTPVLYEAWPRSHFILVDPTRESLPFMQSLARQMDAEFHNVALGTQDGEMEMEVRPDNIGGSSFFHDVGHVPNAVRYKVPVRRFDALLGPLAR